MEPLWITAAVPSVLLPLLDTPNQCIAPSSIFAETLNVLLSVISVMGKGGGGGFIANPSGCGGKGPAGGGGGGTSVGGGGGGAFSSFATVGFTPSSCCLYSLSLYGLFTGASP